MRPSRRWTLQHSSSARAGLDCRSPAWARPSERRVASSPSIRASRCILDLRHRFAITRLAIWHRERVDVRAMLPVLATYLGHGRYSDTASYVTAGADLLAIAAERALAYGETS